LSICRGCVHGIHFLLAADGISRVLVLLTGLAAVAGVLFSWNIELRTNEFSLSSWRSSAEFTEFFSASICFYSSSFTKSAIVPKYFLIAIWGSTRREYAAMKWHLFVCRLGDGAHRLAGGLRQLGQPTPPASSS